MNTGRLRKVYKKLSNRAIPYNERYSIDISRGKGTMKRIDFIIKSKLAGYAGGGERLEKDFGDGFRGFQIISDSYRYIDRYTGFNPFSGSECVFNADGVPIWTLNYFGEVVAKQTRPVKIYSFLREAMLQITPENPFRGPAHLQLGDLRYENLVNGEFERFHGVESIYEGDLRVYILYYHGGSLTQEG